MIKVLSLDSKQKKTIAKTFSATAKTYDAHAFLQQEIGHRLLERLEFFKYLPKTILDLGSGTGFFTEQLLQRYPQAECIALDISLGMLETSLEKPGVQTKKDQIKHLCADAHALPLRNHSIDLIFSNCTLPWCANYPVLFEALYNMLTDNGLLLFTTFGPDTLMELRESFKEGIEGREHPPPFQDMHLLGDALVKAHFQAPVVDRENLTINYQTEEDLLNDLTHVGFEFLVGQDNEHLSGYETFRNNDFYPATFEIIYGYALKNREP